MPFRQFPLASKISPVGCGPSLMLVCRHYPGYHGSQYTTKTCCPLLNSNLSPFMLCGLQYFTYSCAIALVIQPTHSGLTDEMRDE